MSYVTVLKGWIKKLSRDETPKVRRIVEGLPRDWRILEVGCGYGRMLRHFQEFGFTDLTGVEKNADVAAKAAASGLPIIDLDQFAVREKDDSAPYDMLVLSHVIEHFCCEDLLAFMDQWLDKVRPGGRVLILAPLMHQRFWDDLDHIKPYYPQGIKTFFGKKDDQVSGYSRHILRLKDICFRRSPFKLKLSRALLLKKNMLPPMLLNLFFALLFKISGGLIGQTSGWIGLYEKK